MRLALALLCLVCLVVLTSDAQQDRLVVTVTAYSSGHTTASGRPVRVGMIALSRDVERTLGVRFGEKVTLEGIGTFVFEDRMPWTYWRWYRRVDLYLPPKARALQFGIKHHVFIWRVRPGSPGAFAEQL